MAKDAESPDRSENFFAILDIQREAVMGPKETGTI